MFFSKIMSVFKKKEPEPELEFDEEKEAKVVLTKSKKQFVVPKYTPLVQILSPKMFSCMKGHCGTCTIKVVEGEENLNDRPSGELTRGDMRRACQAHVTQGIVKIRA